MPLEIVIKSLVAGLIASFACGLGAIPVLIGRFDAAKHAGLGYGFAGGLMFAASVYNLILPGLNMSPGDINTKQALFVVCGLILGSMFLWITEKQFSHDHHDDEALKKWGGRTGVLVFLAMTLHSIPEGVAVGVGFASDAVHDENLGTLLATAISIHNIPEELAVALPLRAAGASGWKCFLAAFLTSLPQPIAAVPASYAAWAFQPIMPILMGLAAGAMIFLVIMELLPSALSTQKPIAIAWSFMLGFCSMLLAQVLL
jgi:ZIP family zinc transporter